MKRSTLRSAIVTGSAMVGITTSVTAGAANAWGVADDAGSIDFAAPVASSTTTPQTIAQTDPTPSATATKSSSKSKTSTTKKTTKKTSSSSKSTKKATPSASASTPTQSGAQDGTFVGSSAQAGRYGYVQVQITVSGGSLSAIDILQAPSGRNEWYTNRSVPTLIQEAINSQSSSIASVSGSSFTSRAFKNSLQSALSKAGL